MPYVTSVNIACGYHAGDPMTMRVSARLAAEHGVALGAHPGLPDLLGFGRRVMVGADPLELANYCAYQYGALRALAAIEGVPVDHVKPHGALYRMAVLDPAIAEEIAGAVTVIDPSVVLLLLAGPTADAAGRTGARVAREAFVDIHYDDDGNLILEVVKKAWDPELVAQRAVDVTNGTITTVSGKKIPVQADSICLHGDAPNAVAVAAAVRARLEAEGVTVAPLREVLRQRQAA
jgi:UPF0271 protein